MAATAMAAASAVKISVGAHSLRSKTLLNFHSFAPKRRSLSFAPKRHSLTCAVLTKPELSVKEEGRPETLDYRVFFHDSAEKKVSPWHDIPLKLKNGTFNFVVEIPKGTSAKMEVATEEPYTPIKQDTKMGKLRYYPYNIIWNYGLLTQTWEDLSFASAEAEGAFGGNDPVDVVEIGGAPAKIGDVLKVKPLGALAMTDEGDLDWKIIAISLDDPKASLVNDVDDVEKHFPGTLTAIRDWFRDYKIPDGKPANRFGLGNKAANKMALPAEATSEKAGGEVQAPVVAQADVKAQPKTLKKARSSKHSRNTKTSTRSYNDPYQILKYPLTTESALKNLEGNNTLVFIVDKRADKKKIRAAVEKLYDIETKKVNTLMRPDGSKKAYVICKTDVGNKIGFF